MIGEDCPRNYAYPAHNYDRRAVVRVALDPARSVALAQPARSSGRRPDKEMCRAAGRRFLFGGPSARQSENDWRWPAEGTCVAGIPLRGQGHNRCGRVQGGPWTSPERFHTERSKD